MINVLLIAIGSLIGYLYRDLRDKVKDLQKKLPTETPEIGATPASYGITRGYVNTDSEVGLVEAKTPEQLEWDKRQKEQL